MELGILRIDNNGKVVGNGLLGKTYPLNLDDAYGIRNGFGIDFDPLTGNSGIRKMDQTMATKSISSNRDSIADGKRFRVSGKLTEHGSKML